MPDSRIQRAALSAATRARAHGLTQQSIAEAVGASQSQVSRVLSGQSIRSSRLFIEICNYVHSATRRSPARAVHDNAELMDALASTWDGSPRHASALAEVIRSLGVLHPGAPLSKTRRVRSPKD